MWKLAEKFCWYEAGQDCKTPEEAYQRIVNWSGQARGMNPGAFDEVTSWFLGSGAWGEQELEENGKMFKEEILGRFLGQTRCLRAELNALEPSGIVNQAVFGALDRFEEELSGKTRADWLQEAVAWVFEDFAAIKSEQTRKLFAGGVTGAAGTDTVETYGYINILKDCDAGVQWTLFMPDVVRQQQSGFRMESFEYKKLPAMRFIGKGGDIGEDSPEMAALRETLDSMDGYRSGFDYDLVLMHHFGRGVDVEECHCMLGRFMAAGAPVPEGYEYADFVPDNNGESGMPYLSQFAFAKFVGNADFMHRQEGFDCDAMYDVTRNAILGQGGNIPYPAKYWTAEVYLDGFGGECTAYLFSVEI